MLQNIRGKNTKDIESSAETVILNTYQTNVFPGKPSTFSSSLNISNQQDAQNLVDNYIEKRNKE